ncbi:MAG TPA: HDOD domain-containing protein [Planctomycetota bacterium]|nr:HDOD domain-containing protein [Planctomycetota bacterium]
MSAATAVQQIRANPGLIPSLPDVVAQAMQLLEDPEAGPADFEKLLSRDPSLVASMLRLANSPIYGFVHKRETVRDAIIGLGLRGLRGMLLGSSLNKFFGPRYACYGKDAKSLWRHAMAVGTGAKLLTKQLPGSPDDAEEMFVAGLLHDLGKLLLGPFLSSMGKDLTVGKEAVHLAEERLLGIDHQEAGGLVAAKWNLKPMVTAVITHHHFRACPKDHRHAIAVVRLADLCATANGHGAGTLEPESTFLAEDLAVVGWQPEQWEAARASITEAVQVALATP